MRRLPILVAVAGATAVFGPTAATAKSVTFPPAFVGRWGETLQGCSAGAVHGGITIASTQVSDGEFHGRLLAVEARSSRTVQTSEAWDFENAPASVADIYALSADGRRLSVTENGLHPDVSRVEHYVRCEQ